MGFSFLPGRRMLLTRTSKLEGGATSTALVTKSRGFRRTQGPARVPCPHMRQMHFRMGIDLWRVEQFTST